MHFFLGGGDKMTSSKTEIDQINSRMLPLVALILTLVTGAWLASTGVLTGWISSLLNRLFVYTSPTLLYYVDLLSALFLFILGFLAILFFLWLLLQFLPKSALVIGIM